MHELEAALHKQERSRHTASCIVFAAHELFGRFGPNVSLREISERAGVCLSTLTERFPSRRLLVEAVREYDQAEEAARLDHEAAAARHASVALEERLRRAMVTYLRRKRERAPQLAAISEHCAASPDFARARTAFVRHQRARLIKELRAAVGDRWSEEVEVRARMGLHILYAMGGSLASEADVGAIHGPVEPDGLIDRLVAVVLDYLDLGAR